MATHYTCDRCGAGLHGPGRQIAREATIDWPDNGQRDTDTVILTFSVQRHPWDPETPDLCDDCYAHILHEVASMLDTDRTPMEKVEAR